MTSDGAPRAPARTGTLFLIPTGLGGVDPARLLAPATFDVLARLRRFFVENEKSARAFLKACGHPLPLREVQMVTVSEHTSAGSLPGMLTPLLAGEEWGILAEAGCPSVADPGADLVRLAHSQAIRVVPLAGPSAVLLALMASGMNGQHFEFHGYVPIDSEARNRALRYMEERAARSGATQIFIETPYRNEALLQALLASCRGDTRLCLAIDITLPGESIITRTIAQWRREHPAVQRRPTVFLIWRD